MRLEKEISLIGNLGKFINFPYKNKISGKYTFSLISKFLKNLRSFVDL